MEKIKIPTSFNIELDFETPEFHKRFFAWVIDLAILYAYYRIVIHILQTISATHTPSGSDLPFLYNLSAIKLLFFLPLLLYHLVCEVAMNGQSIGKKIIGIKVIGENGGRAFLYQYLIRWLTRPFDFFFFGIVALLSFGLTKKNQRLGDLAAGTLVIKTRIDTDINDTVFFELMDGYKPRFPEVMRLSDRDMNTIKGVLNNTTRYNNFDVAERLSDKIRTVLHITEYMEAVVFLETLLKDYNYYSNRD